MATKEKRKLKDLNLLDKFLFDEAMEDKENMKTLLDIILGQDTKLKYPTQTEKERRASNDKRQIRLDVMQLMKMTWCMIQNRRRETRKTFQKEADCIRE